MVLEQPADVLEEMASYAALVKRREAVLQRARVETATLPGESSSSQQFAADRIESTDPTEGFGGLVAMLASRRIQRWWRSKVTRCGLPSRRLLPEPVGSW